jgi:hypothetical protein
MRKMLVCTFVAMMFAGAGVGCDKNKSESSSGDAMKMSTDACAHCPGPKCGMKVKG